MRLRCEWRYQTGDGAAVVAALVFADEQLVTGIAVGVAMQQSTDRIGRVDFIAGVGGVVWLCVEESG